MELLLVYSGSLGDGREKEYGYRTMVIVIRKTLGNLLREKYHKNENVDYEKQISKYKEIVAEKTKKVFRR